MKLEIEERKRTDQMLRRRDAILSAMSLAAEQFLKAGTLDDKKVENLLARLGKATKVSRVYIFENHVGGDGTLLTSQRHEWAADGIPLQGDNPDLHNFPWRAGGMGRWEEMLKKGQVVQGNVKQFPESEKRILDAQHIQSIVAVPIFIDAKWWGFIGFDECRSEREWSEAEISALKTTGALLGALIDRKQIEKALKESEKRYSLATSAGSVGVWDWNVETNEIFVDPNLKAMLGYADHEIKNHLDDWGKFVHPDDGELVMAEAEKHFKGLTPQYEVVHRMLHKDGGIRWFLARGTAIRDKTGKPYRVVGTDTDITERRLAAEALEKAHKQLEQKVKERTEELRALNEELKTKSENLEEANVALKVLLKKRDADRIELEEKVLINLKELVEPYLEKVKNAGLNNRQKVFIDIIETNLKDVISPFSHRLSSKYFSLTPSEIQVANLIKQGKKTKEIADLLNMSIRAVCFHRQNVRKKLGIKNQKTNLRTHLLSTQL